MKMFFPAFGDEAYICKKWCVCAETKEQAFEKAKVFWSKVSKDEAPYFYPVQHWVGPLVEMVENTGQDGVFIM